MKIGFIIVLYKTPEKEVKRLRLEVRSLQFQDYKIYFVDNTKDNKGYAAAINKGIRQGLIDNCQLFIIANPDISLKNLKARDVLEAGKYFDIWGLAMKMQQKIFYGGEIDRWRLSGSLIKKKPSKRFIDCEFISGSLMFIKKNVIENIGLFEESYFMYYEDVDYCVRARKLGYKVGIDTEPIYEHFENSKYNPDKGLLISRAKSRFFSKYSNVWQKIYELGRSTFLINFLSLNISSLINKILNFVLFIYLIRYLTPSEYGIYTLVWAQVALYSPIVDLGTTSYGIVYLPTEKKEKFVEMFNLRLVASIVIFFLTIFSGIYFYRDKSRVIGYIFLTSFVIFSNMLSGSYLIKNAVEKKLYHSSLISILFNLVLILTTIIFAIKYQSLPVIFLIIFILYNAYSLVNFYLIKKDIKSFYFSVNLKNWQRFIRNSYVFVFISFFAGLYFKLDIFILQYLKGTNQVGIYSAGYKFFEAMIFVASSYNIARTPTLALLVKKNPDLFHKALKKDLAFLILVGFTLTLLIYFLSPFILPYVLRDNYFNSIGVVRIVIFAFPLILLSSVFLNAIYVLKKANLVIRVFLIQVIVNLILNVIFIPRYSYIASAYITVLSELINLIILIIIFNRVNQEFKYEYKHL